LCRAGRLAPTVTLHIIKQVAAALMATHAKGIVHRDLKPGNIYLLEAAGAADFVKVLDFGISKMRSATLKLTRTSSIMGTPSYMSPEQAEGKVSEIDERTDQWALACIAWECLCGETPFLGDSIPAIMLQVVARPPAPLLPKVAGLHPQVEDVLLRALAKNKHERFASVGDLATALEAALTGAAAKLVPSVSRTLVASDTAAAEAVQGESPAHATTFTQTAGAFKEDDEEDDELAARPKRWIWAAAVGAAAILVVGVILLLRSGPAQTPMTTSPPPAAAAPVQQPRPPPALPSPSPSPSPSLAPSPPPPPPPVAAEEKSPAPGSPSAEKKPQKSTQPRRLAPAEPEPKPPRPPAPRPRAGRRMIEDL